MSIKHTPTPWLLDGAFIGTSQRCIGKVGQFRAVPTLTDEDAANGDLIVRAVNAHDDLLAVVKRWQQFAKDNGWTDRDYHDADGTGWISLTNAAIAKAEGQA